VQVETDLPWKQIIEASKAYDLDEALIGAIIAVESAGRPFATRYEPHYRWLFKVEEWAKKTHVTVGTETIHQKTSWGLMQLMGALLRELGFEDAMPQACHPVTNIRYGAKHVSKLYDRYGDMDDVIAAYNAGSPRRTETGVYENQSYVDKVYGYYDEILKLRG
jgi:soluble lytic murein transglycosylase-like protein